MFASPMITWARAIEYPPEDTRAYFRGCCLRKYPRLVGGETSESKAR